MIPTDGFTHSMLLSYHAGIEDDLPEPTMTPNEVEQEILHDEWEALLADNGEYQPRSRSRRRSPMLDETPDE